MENNYENNRRKSFVTMRMIYDFTMAGLIIAMAVIFLWGNKMGLSLIDNIDSTMRYSFAALCLLYGGFRLYRGIKHDY